MHRIHSICNIKLFFQPVIQIPESQSSRSFSPSKVAIVYPSAASGTKTSSAVEQTTCHQNSQDLKAQPRPFVTLSHKQEVATQKKTSHDQDHKSRDENTEARDQDLQSREQSLKRKTSDTIFPLDLSVKKSRDIGSPIKRVDVVKRDKSSTTSSFSNVCPEAIRTTNGLELTPSGGRSNDYLEASGRLKKRPRDYVFMKFKVDRMKSRHPNARSFDYGGTTRDINQSIAKNADMRRMRSDSHLHQTSNQRSPKSSDSFHFLSRRRQTEQIAPISTHFESLFHHYVQNMPRLANRNFFFQNGNLQSAVSCSLSCLLRIIGKSGK